MALTITPSQVAGFVEDPTYIDYGRYRLANRIWTLSGTYVTNGHAYTSADLNIGTGTAVEIDFPDGLFRNATNAVIPIWDSANSKVMFFWSTTGAGIALIEVANTTSLTGYAGRIRIRYVR